MRHSHGFRSVIAGQVARNPRPKAPALFVFGVDLSRAYGGYPLGRCERSGERHSYDELVNVGTTRYPYFVHRRFEAEENARRRAAQAHNGRRKAEYAQRRLARLDRQIESQRKLAPDTP